MARELAGLAVRSYFSLPLRSMELRRGDDYRNGDEGRVAGERISGGGGL